MVTTVDSRRRIALPKPVAEGEVFRIDAVGTGKFLLTRVKEAVGSSYKLTKINGYLMIRTNRKVTAAAVNKALVGFP